MLGGGQRVHAYYLVPSMLQKTSSGRKDERSVRLATREAKEVVMTARCRRYFVSVGPDSGETASPVVVTKHSNMSHLCPLDILSTTVRFTVIVHTAHSARSQSPTTFEAVGNYGGGDTVRWSWGAWGNAIVPPPIVQRVHGAAVVRYAGLSSNGGP